jgi:hypothetical protein
METKTVMMPRALTAENGAKALLIGEFTEDVKEECVFCENGIDEDGELCKKCHGDGYTLNQVGISWTTIKAIYAKCVEHFGT